MTMQRIWRRASSSPSSFGPSGAGGAATSGLFAGAGAIPAMSSPGTPDVRGLLESGRSVVPPRGGVPRRSMIRREGSSIMKADALSSDATHPPFRVSLPGLADGYGGPAAPTLHSS